jgi:hypothetical protein
MYSLPRFKHSHGGQEFWDPVTEQEFVYNDPKRSLNTSWWGGEPVSPGLYIYDVCFHLGYSRYGQL